MISSLPDSASRMQHEFFKSCLEPHNCTFVLEALPHLVFSKGWNWNSLRINILFFNLHGVMKTLGGAKIP